MYELNELEKMAKLQIICTFVHLKCRISMYEILNDKIPEIYGCRYGEMIMVILIKHVIRFWHALQLFVIPTSVFYNFLDFKIWL